MLDAAGVGRQTRLLDAGCGAGGCSVLAAGRGAAVNGLDAAETLLAIARARVPDGDFRAGDLEDLPYASASFDAIIAADVLAYVADPLAALRELRRVCVPQGRVVLAVWGALEQGVQHAVTAAVRDVVAGALDENGAFSWGHLATPRVLDALITQAGLAVLGSGTVLCPAEYPDWETAWRAQASAGPLQAALQVVSEGRLRAAVLGALAPFSTATEGVRVQHCFRYVSAVPAESRSARRECRA
jgi:SAM-dependent methyltransferase